MDSATVTNSFHMVLDKGVVLDGIVMWTMAWRGRMVR